MDAVEEIKKRLNIEDIIGEYIELKRAGRNYKALSPFTGEKTASFMVSPDKQIWHDFSSNKGGDVFSFVMEVEGLDFKGAMEVLARKAGVDLDLYRGNSGTSKRKEVLYSVMESACNYYQHCLVKNNNALRYLRQNRGYSKQTISDFRMGYSPTKGSLLYEYLIKKGFADKDISEAGLISRRSGKALDMFRGRVMIPLSDAQGRVVGFTARSLNNETTSSPKYINTPSTLLYDKGRQLFGLNLAKQRIREENFVVVVEGNLDVVASHQSGIKNVVAVAGTALTGDHLKSISRLTDDIRFAFDQDRAGVAATQRAVDISQSLNSKISVITLPSGKDPDDLIKQDPNLWKESVKSSKYAMDWLMEFYENKHDLSSASGKKFYTDVILNSIKKLKDPVEKEHYLKKLSKKIDISLEALIRKLGKTNEPKKPKKPIKTNSSTNEISDQEQRTIQDQLLGLALLNPELRRCLERLQADDLRTSEGIELAKILLDNSTKKETLSSKDLYKMGDYVKIVAFKAEELYGEYSRQQKEQEALALIQKLQKLQKNFEQRKLTEMIKEAEAIGDKEKMEKLLEDYQKLLIRD